MEVMATLIGNKWSTFLESAFKISDCFSLKIYDFFAVEPSGNYLGVLNDLEQWEIRDFSYVNNHEPQKVFGEYEIKFYECNFFTQKVIMLCGDIDNFVFPKYPDDLCFYFDNYLWFKSITHENLMYIDSKQTEILTQLRKSGCDLCIDIM